MNNDKKTTEAEMTNIMVEPTTSMSTPTDPTSYPPNDGGVNIHNQQDSLVTITTSRPTLDPKEELNETYHRETKGEESQEGTNHMSAFSPSGTSSTQQDQYPYTPNETHPSPPPTTTTTSPEEMAPPYNEDDAIEDDEDFEQLASEDIHTIHSCDSETHASIRSGTGVGIMNDKMSELMRTWSHDDNGVIKKDATTDDKKIPNFQPGDHVIRWKMIKVMLYPIQIHGIVLSVEKDASGTKVVIADFGMSSSQARKKNGLETMNKTMNNAVYETTKAMNNLFGVGAPKKSNRDDDSDIDRELEASMKNIKSSSGDDDDKRFHIRTITSSDDIRKWSKVNYGQSLFSSKGKLDKLKKMFTFPQKKDDDANASNATTTDDVSSSFFDEDDDFFKVSDGNLEPVSEATHGSDNEINATSRLNPSNHTDGGTNGNTTTPTSFSKSPTKAPSRSRKNDRIPASVAITTTHNADNLTNSDIKTLEQMIAEANDIDRKQRSRRIFRGKAKQSFDEMSTSSTASSMSLSSHFSNLRPSLSINRIKGEAGNIMKKLSFNRPKAPVDNDDTKTVEDGENGPKLPKSDHRSIVLARVRFILAEQEKKETESCLPPYHIFYSNSECIAVWCKTGKFCTLQAAVFLHSTAICNVKSTVMLTAGVAATQPWLIPVVGVYGIVAIGMPYMILNKCQKKWKNSEQALTDGFWAEADNDVIVTAIEQWSDLCPEKRVNTDEVGMN